MPVLKHSEVYLKLGYFDTQLRNVGDDLNPYIFKHYFPNMDNVHPDCVFIGIGSIFDGRFSPSPQKLVFGPGARGANALPELDNSWDIRFVRGPLTQAAVQKQGIECPYISDPGLLISEFFEPKSANAQDIGLIPYFRTEHQPWQEIADRLSFKLISPRLSVEEFANSIRQCRFVVTEAMHGAIIADALRVPWLPYSSITASHEKETHQFKWTDWCQSVGMEFSELNLPILWNPKKMGIASRLKQAVKKRIICNKLKHYASADNALLSDDKIFSERMQQLKEQIKKAQKDYNL
ncbi:polysaccharide pyruvyl transferase family protein [Aliiglaciecola sp. CAU 1673]|uniref:polysaccharide pyruvyl transferase family protein n=1 Tax=Aliiglaciecola sp. CAU 1673 TaxID=3032595 RepID=UPI0023DA25B6|nr:polysaccharide pyruvyl transferase family protein [Aliiglaciecola sp. CAU 1673]MDF2177297.1 polysaccharide pyruvyl transferase family protein [Aliiglaciecola sp. CAU 1673]